MTEPQSGAELLARIQPRLRERRIQLCLRPDLIDQWDDLNTELQTLITDTVTKPGRLVGPRNAEAETESEPVRSKAEQIKALEDEIAECSPWFTIRALPKADYAVLREAHPPRPGNQVDQWLGYDRDAVGDAAVRPCLVDPVFDDESWATFLATLTNGEWSALREAVDDVNGVVTDLPKSGLAERVLSRRAAASKSRKNGESPPASSTAGPPAKSMSTSTQTGT